MPPADKNKPRDGRKSVRERTRNLPRTTKKASVPLLRDPYEIAKEIAPDRPDQISAKLRVIQTNPELYDGNFGAAFEAVYQVMLARFDGWMWTETGGVPSLPPEAGSSTPIPLPAWAVEAIATGWQQFSRGPNEVTRAFDLVGSRQYRNKRQVILKKAMRAVQAEDARSSTGGKLTDEAMAEAQNVDAKTVARDRREYQPRLAQRFAKRLGPAKKEDIK
jgi:hypothetical protein